MEPIEKILQDVQRIRTKYLEAINIIRVLNVTDHAKLFHGLEHLMSGYKDLEQLDNYIQNCGPVVISDNNRVQNIAQVNCDPEPSEFNEDGLENSFEEEDMKNFQGTTIQVDPMHSTPRAIEMGKRKLDTDDENCESNVKKQRKEKYCDEIILPVDTMHAWEMLNQRAMDKDPNLEQHIQSYSSPEKWISDILRYDILVEFEEDPMEMLSSPLLSLLFDHWNRKFAESRNNPKFCVRNVLLKMISKSNRKVSEKIRVRRTRNKVRLDMLIKDGKQNSEDWRRIEALDAMDKKRQEQLCQVRARRRSLNSSKGSAEANDQTDTGAKRLDKEMLQKQLNRKRKKKSSLELSESEEDFLLLYE